MASTTNEPLTEQEILNTYRQMQAEMQSLIQQLTKFEMERNEHALVEETLQPLDPDRRAFRLVGGVLVEQTVREVLPPVKMHQTNVRKLFEVKKRKFRLQEKGAAVWKAKYNIKTQEEVGVYILTSQ
ncbi:hypothetical protein ACHAWX_002916 [Stephanocyclus meneghinianus]